MGIIQEGRKKIVGCRRDLENPSDVLSGFIAEARAERPSEDTYDPDDGAVGFAFKEPFSLSKAIRRTSSTASWADDLFMITQLLKSQTNLFTKLSESTSL